MLTFKIFLAQFFSVLVLGVVYIGLIAMLFLHFLVIRIAQSWKRRWVKVRSDS